VTATRDVAAKLQNLADGDSSGELKAYVFLSDPCLVPS
jgi:hypothetical protein